MLMSALESPVRPGRKLKLAYFASHPIQYQAPMLRRLQQEENLDVTAFFFSDKSVGGYWMFLCWEGTSMNFYRSCSKKNRTAGFFFVL